MSKNESNHTDSSCLSSNGYCMFTRNVRCFKSRKYFNSDQFTDEKRSVSWQNESNDEIDVHSADLRRCILPLWQRMDRDVFDRYFNMIMSMSMLKIVLNVHRLCTRFSTNSIRISSVLQLRLVTLFFSRFINSPHFRSHDQSMQTFRFVWSFAQQYSSLRLSSSKEKTIWIVCQKLIFV